MHMPTSSSKEEVKEKKLMMLKSLFLKTKIIIIFKYDSDCNTNIGKSSSKQLQYNCIYIFKKNIRKIKGKKI